MRDPFLNLRHGLVGAWCPSLQPGGSLVVRDFSPYGSHAVNPPFTSQIAWEQGAVRFSNSVERPLDPPTRFLGTMTMPATWSMSCWYRAESTQSGEFGLVSHIPAGTTPINGWMLLASGTTLYAYVNNGTRASVSGVFATGSWRQAGITSDGATVRLFSNGVQVASGAYAVAPAVSGLQLKIGRYNNFRFNGLMDDIRIWHRTLSASDMRVLASQRGIGLLPRRRRRPTERGSQFFLNVSGTWKQATPFINVGGTWKQANPLIRAGGAWK